MNALPPHLALRDPKRDKRLAIGVVAGALVIILSVAYFLFSPFCNSSLRNRIETEFGDQAIKTALALIELHKVRYGTYPDTLRDLRFLGGWDQGIQYKVKYCPSADRTRYYIELERGWLAKPDLQMPEGFWTGTGYSSALKPKTE